MKTSRRNRLLVAFIAPIGIVLIGFQLAFWSAFLRPSALYDYTILFLSLVLGAYVFSPAVEKRKGLWVSIYILVMFILLFYVGFTVACINGACL
jgi:hypothetical protein